jgi:alpha-beta hydrolase superfamily lysophospholipase
MRSFQKDMESEMAHEDIDLSFLDRPEILEIVFYPRTSNIRPLAPNAKDHFIEVEKGIRIGCRYHTVGKDYPSLLYFHGNAMIVDDMDLFAPLFNDVGVNLFVAGYRGFGLSNDTPTVTNMFKDSHRVFEGFKKTVEDYGFRKSFFVMGFSLGSFSAIELAYNYQDDLQGLIVQSGSSNNLKQYVSPMVPLDHPIWKDDSTFLNKVKLRSISKPTLIIHGEKDSRIPVDEAKELYENSAAKDKRLVIIPDADHGDLFIVGKEQYYKAIREFVKNYS